MHNAKNLRAGSPILSARRRYTVRLAQRQIPIPAEPRQYCVERAKGIGPCDRDDDETPIKPCVTEPMEVDILDAFETLNTLLSTLGYPISDPIIKDEASEQFFLKGKDTEVTGELVKDGFVVRAGALAGKELAALAVDYVTPRRVKLIEGAEMVEQDEQYHFTQRYPFNTPSGAAALVFGRTSNGWIEWKNAEDMTLHDMKRTESEALE